MTPADAAVYRKGLEAGAKVADAHAKGATCTDPWGLASPFDNGQVHAATVIAAAIRALPVPEGGEVEAEAAAVELATRQAAVAIVDSCHGFTCEFNTNPDEHRRLYDMAQHEIAAALRAARGRP